MRNKYHQDIIDVLKEADGRSMPVRLIARHIYNKKVGLFAGDLSYTEIYQSIRFYLWSQSNRPSSPFIKGERRGYYTVRKEVFSLVELDFTTPYPDASETDGNPKEKEKDNPPSGGIPLFD